MKQVYQREDGELFYMALRGEPLSCEKPMRMTRQRQVILEVLKKVQTHPTAADVYIDVRKELSHISLGTVYRNLETLAACGAIQKLEGVGTQKRFDTKLDRHHHIQCSGCGRIEDVPVGSQELKEKIERALENNSGFTVMGHCIVYSGICPECKNGHDPTGDQKGE